MHMMPPSFLYSPIIVGVFKEVAVSNITGSVFRVKLQRP